MKKFIAILILALSVSCVSQNYENACVGHAGSVDNNIITLLNVVTGHQFTRWSMQPGTSMERVFTGDSIVAIWGALPFDKGGYNWFNGRNTATVVNTGIGGNRICDLVERERSHITAFNPKYIFVHIGGNDLLAGQRTEKIIQRLKLLFHSVRESNPFARIVYGAIPPTQVEHANKLKSEINLAAANILYSIGNACIVDVVDLVDDGDPTAPSREDVKGDGVHFDLSVYPKYRDRVEAAFGGYGGCSY